MAFLCFSFVLGVVCWLISRRVEGLYERVAIEAAAGRWRVGSYRP